MEQGSYAITFTGNFLRPLAHEAQWAQLRKLFPHATESELLEFFKSRRLVIARTETESAARELVSVLGDHGLDCEYSHQAVSQADTPSRQLPPPHARHFAPLKAQRQPFSAQAPTVATAATGTPSPAGPAAPVDEDALTPRGRRWVILASVAIGSLTVYSIWSSTHSLYGAEADRDNGEMIPSLCALHESTSWFSGHGTYSLACSASNEHGRYKLLMSCTGPDDLTVRLAFYDGAGNPRAPAWDRSASPARLLVTYQLADGTSRTIALMATGKAHIGRLQGLNATAAGSLLANSSVRFSQVFANESVSFQLEPARWYVNAFIFSCQLARAP